MKITIEEFWNRFKEKSDKLMDLDSLDSKEQDEILNSVDSDLKQYSQGLSLEIGKLGTNGRKLTLTAEGDVDYFEDLINLYEQSPILDFWDIVAFKQGKGANVSISFENYHLSSKKMWFMPVVMIVKDDKIIDYKMETLSEKDLNKFFKKNGM